MARAVGKYFAQESGSSNDVQMVREMYCDRKDLRITLMMIRRSCYMRALINLPVRYHVYCFMFVAFFITSGIVYSPLMESPRFQKDTAVPDPHFSSHFTQLLTPDVHTE